MKFEVELWMFQEGQIRTVEVPDDELTGKVKGDLEAIFKYGQNDFQPLPLPSVSVGDVVRYRGERHLVVSIGFRPVTPENDPALVADREARTVMILREAYK